MIKSPEPVGRYLLEIFSALDDAGASEVEIKITRHRTLNPEGIEFSVSGRIGNKGLNVSHVKVLEGFALGFNSTKHSFATLRQQVGQFIASNEEIEND